MIYHTLLHIILYLFVCSKSQIESSLRPKSTFQKGFGGLQDALKSTSQFKMGLTTSTGIHITELSILPRHYVCHLWHLYHKWSHLGHVQKTEVRPISRHLLEPRPCGQLKWYCWVKFSNAWVCFIIKQFMYVRWAYLRGMEVVLALSQLSYTTDCIH